MAARLTSEYHSAYFCALFYGNKAQIEVLNTAHPRFDIEADTYESIYADVTSLDNIELIHAAWMPTAPRYKRERPEPVGATGAAKPQAAETQPLDDDLLLVIEDPDPWAHDNEPIFWTD